MELYCRTTVTVRRVTTITVLLLAVVVKRIDSIFPTQKPVSDDKPLTAKRVWPTAEQWLILPPPVHVVVRFTRQKNAVDTRHRRFHEV